jgi:hypothetical protein
MVKLTKNSSSNSQSNGESKQISVAAKLLGTKTSTSTSSKPTQDARSSSKEVKSVSSKSGSIGSKIAGLTLPSGKPSKSATMESTGTGEDKQDYTPKSVVGGLEKKETAELPASADTKDFKKKEKDSTSHKLAGLVTQVKPGQMFNSESSKKVDLDKEIQKVHTPRGDNSHRATKPSEIEKVHGGPESWKNYYVKSLIECLKSTDDADTMVKLYKEHFYQTVQSILFLQNVEKIDDNLLVEKKVYLPPNILSKLLLDPREENAYPGFG